MAHVNVALMTICDVDIHYVNKALNNWLLNSYYDEATVVRESYRTQAQCRSAMHLVCV